jgi:hypothetical protein
MRFKKVIPTKYVSRRLHNCTKESAKTTFVKSGKGKSCQQDCHVAEQRCRLELTQKPTFIARLSAITGLGHLAFLIDLLVNKAGF